MSMYVCDARVEVKNLSTRLQKNLIKWHREYHDLPPASRPVFRAKHCVVTPTNDSVPSFSLPLTSGAHEVYFSLTPKLQLPFFPQQALAIV